VSPTLPQLSAVIEFFLHRCSRLPLLSLCQLLQPGCIAPLQTSALITCKSTLPPFFPSLTVDNSSISPPQKSGLFTPEANRTRVAPIPPNWMEAVVHTESEQHSASQVDHPRPSIITDGQLRDKPPGLNIGDGGECGMENEEHSRSRISLIPMFHDVSIHRVCEH